MSRTRGTTGTEHSGGLPRRALLKGVAWTLPAIAVVAAAPVAAATGTVPNDEANYYWDAESVGTYTKVEAAQSGLSGTFSTQISYRANPWTNPPADATLQVIVTFTQDVTIVPPAGWTLVGSATGQTFVFQRTPAGFGGALSFNFTGTVAGPVTATPTMSLINGGSATWSSLSEPGSAVLVA
ncbi:hypothetical protein [Microbacterium sp. No. 7]|uniref:hypothetical protein n=1 Tax=Microbacterium sp. No. 7 TaxID=1714373 RepID=UPI0006D1AFEF|nr:hypothetical protein [Microbacterium sp. No. 7]ALJ19095.1 hypothetical protein AOA12_03920 [Microbacterium sp. No. 7]